MLFSCAGQFEGISDDAIAGPACEYALLHRHIELGIPIEPPSHLRVFSFTVFTDDNEVDVSGLATAEGAGDSLQQTGRAPVYILFEPTANGNQQPPERNVVGHSGITHRSQANGIKCPQLLKSVDGHHAASIEITLATPIEVLPGERQVKPPSRRLEHPNSFGHHFVADSVTFDYRYPISFQ